MLIQISNDYPIDGVVRQAGDIVEVPSSVGRSLILRGKATDATPEVPAGKKPRGNTSAAAETTPAP
jgi:hypothetical protein